MPIDNTRIAKNTILMYIRMAITILIGLFSVRIVLKAIGIQDYGLYNVVSGIVVMLAFLNNTLAGASQRFLSYELGKGNYDRLSRIFGTSIFLYIAFCLLIVILAETIGLWYVNYKLTIPSGRIIATNWIYQFSILSFIFTVISAPYNACIISHEKMEIYAYVSIAEALLKLSLVYYLLICNGDKLILYGLFLMIISLVQYIFYRIYCRKQFVESHYYLNFQKDYIKEFGTFAGWNVWGAISQMCMGQGVNLLLNAFFNVVINAARGLAYQVDRAINSLVQNFFIAIRPQIVKNYASGEFDDMYKMVFISTRLGYYLMFVISIIFIIGMPAILSLWLGEYPEETVLFADLVIIANLINVISQPFSMVIIASGKIAKYQFICGLANILVLPVSWILLKISDDYNLPFYVIIISATIASAWTFIRSYQIQKFNVSNLIKILIRLLIVTLIVTVTSYSIKELVKNNIIGLIILSISIFTISVASIIVFDLSKLERIYILHYLKNFFKHKK